MLTWIRNLLGIRKDVIDTNKAKIDTLKAELEVDKLEDEEHRAGNIRSWRRG